MKYEMEIVIEEHSSLKRNWTFYEILQPFLDDKNKLHTDKFVIGFFVEWKILVIKTFF